MRTVGAAYLPTGTLDRWAAIQAGRLPEGDDSTQTPPTPEQVDDRETVALAEIQAWGDDREATIREEADEERQAARAEADELDDQADAAVGQVAGGLRRRANNTRDRADETYRGRQAEMDEVAEEVRALRAEARQVLRAEYGQMVEGHDERVAELRGGLDLEVAATVNQHYFGGAASIDLHDWRLT